MEKREIKEIKFESEKDMPPMAMSLASMEINKTGTWRNIRPVIDYEKCVKCMNCWKFCPDASVEIEDDLPRINYDYCKGCGICAEECPKNCISMLKEK